MRNQITPRRGRADSGLYSAETLCTEQHNYHSNRAARTMQHGCGINSNAASTTDDGKDICPLDSTDAAPHRPRPRRRLYQVIICGRSGSFGRSPHSQVRHATAEVPSEAARSASAPRPSGPAYRRPARAGGVGRSRRQILLRVSREIGLGEIGSGVARSG